MLICLLCLSCRAWTATVTVRPTSGTLQRTVCWLRGCWSSVQMWQTPADRSSSASSGPDGSLRSTLHRCGDNTNSQFNRRMQLKAESICICERRQACVSFDHFCCLALDNLSHLWPLAFWAADLAWLCVCLRSCRFIVISVCSPRRRMRRRDKGCRWWCQCSTGTPAACPNLRSLS